MGLLFQRFSLTKAVQIAVSSGTTAQLEHLELTFPWMAASFRSVHARAFS